MHFVQMFVDIPGATVVGVHYSVNKPLSGVQAGQWNYDITSKSGKQRPGQSHRYPLLWSEPLVRYVLVGAAPLLMCIAGQCFMDIVPDCVFLMMAC